MSVTPNTSANGGNPAFAGSSPSSSTHRPRGRGGPSSRSVSDSSSQVSQPGCFCPLASPAPLYARFQRTIVTGEGIVSAVARHSSSGSRPPLALADRMCTWRHLPSPSSSGRESPHPTACPEPLPFQPQLGLPATLRCWCVIFELCTPSRSDRGLCV